MGIYVGNREVRSVFLPYPIFQTRPTSIYVGDRQVWPPANRTLEMEFTTTSAPTEGVTNSFFSDAMARYDIEIPWWATMVDFVTIGGGNGGNGGSGSNSNNHGTGGRSAPWVSGTRPVRTNLSTSQVAVGKGGKGYDGREGTGQRGYPSHFNFTTGASVASNPPNQPSGYGDHWGQSPGNFTAFGRTFTGGSGGDRGNPGFPGSSPGAGGGGGNGGIFTQGRPGGNGGDGYVWLRFKSS